VAIYSTFLQRAYDQLLHDVAIQNLDVLFAIDRAGIVGADGATHTGNFDISFCRCIPGVMIMTPANASELHALLNTGYHYPGPALVRYPRDNSTRPQQIDTETVIEPGQAQQLREGEQIAILVFGPLFDIATPLAEQFDCSLVNMRFVKPLDTDLLSTLAQTHQHFFILEDQAEPGGAGSAVSEWVMQQGCAVRCHLNGLGDSFPDQGSRTQVLSDYGLDAESLALKLTQLTDKDL
jgi:1-deoxy-D-xylulose-5-phosphate synthase